MGSSSRLLVVVEFRLAAAGIVVAVWRDLLEEDMMFGMMNGGCCWVVCWLVRVSSGARAYVGRL